MPSNDVGGPGYCRQPFARHLLWWCRYAVTLSLRYLGWLWGVANCQTGPDTARGRPHTCVCNMSRVVFDQVGLDVLPVTSVCLRYVRDESHSCVLFSVSWASFTYSAVSFGIIALLWYEILHSRAATMAENEENKKKERMEVLKNSYTHKCQLN